MSDKQGSAAHGRAIPRSSGRADDAPEETGSGIALPAPDVSRSVVVTCDGNRVSLVFGASAIVLSLDGRRRAGAPV